MYHPHSDINQLYLLKRGGGVLIQLQLLLKTAAIFFAYLHKKRLHIKTGTEKQECQKAELCEKNIFKKMKKILSNLKSKTNTKKMQQNKSALKTPGRNGRKILSVANILSEPKILM